MKKAVIMAGGTGGHVFPALALAGELSARGWKILWLGGSEGIETTAVPAAGYALEVLGTQGIRGKGPLKKVLGLVAAVKATRRARDILRSAQPNVVISLGGYTAGPGGLAAKMLGLPLVIHEQNAVAGLTNKILAKFADEVAQAFPSAFAKAHTLGNPVRTPIVKLPAPEARNHARSTPLRVLVFGGSQGAQALNEQVPQAIAELGLPLQVWHQAGRGKADAAREAYSRAPMTAVVEARVVEFIERMEEAYFWADLVIGRAGALTVSEIACAGVPAILVPLPGAVDDHQTQNGRWLERAGAATVVAQADLKTHLAGHLKTWLSDPELLKAGAAKARSIAITNATHRLANLCEDTAQ